VYNTAVQIGGPLMLAILSTVATSYTAKYAGNNSVLAAQVYGIHAAFIATTAFVLLATVLCALLLRQLPVKAEKDSSL